MKTKISFICLIHFLIFCVTNNILKSQIQDKVAGVNFHNYFTTPHEFFDYPYSKQLMNSKDKFHKQNSSGAGKHTNTNLSLDSFPQNEPSIKFNHKNPNYVLAAWRDFRTGYSPIIRRIGYSYSSDGGLTWSESRLIPQLDPLHPRSSDPAVISDASGNFYVATVSGNLNNEDWIVLVYKSTDFGKTFSSAVNVAPHVPVIENDDKEYVTCDLSPTSPFINTLYVVWKRINEDGNSAQSLISKSTDEGITWSAPVQILSPALSTFGAIIPVTDTDGNLYIVGYGINNLNQTGLYICRSTDTGNSFTSSLIAADGLTSLNFPSMAIDNSGGIRNNYLYASWVHNMTGINKVYSSFSTNAGLNWSDKIAVDPDNITSEQWFPWTTVSSSGFIYCVYHQAFGSFLSYKSFIAKSTNGGITFTRDTLSSFFSNVGSGTPGGHYIGMDSKGGRTIPVWVDQSESGINSEIYSSVILDNPTIINHYSGILPGQFTLYQNYPNPFNPVSKIKFDITRDARREMQDVRLVIYDALGKEVTTLVNKKLSAGSYEVEFNGTGLSSGVYFYQLTAGDFNEVKRMVLLK